VYIKICHKENTRAGHNNNNNNNNNFIIAINDVGIINKVGCTYVVVEKEKFDRLARTKLEQ
jgi:hypothetical protein